VTARVMGDVYATYNPAEKYSTEEAASVEAPSDKVLGGSLDADERTSTRLQNETRQEYDLLSKRKQWQMLTD
jgi:hypothetical protein